MSQITSLHEIFNVLRNRSVVNPPHVVKLASNSLTFPGCFVQDCFMDVFVGFISVIDFGDLPI